jgi:SSS family solute:Na+ symporter
MNPTMIIGFLFFAGIVACTLWYKSRKNKVNSLNGLFFANRSLGFLLVGGGLLFTNINTASIIGENELTYTNNMTVMAWGVTSVLAMLLVSEFIMPLYLKMGIATTPDFLTARYSAGVGKLVSVIFLISYIFNLLPSVLYAGAIAFNGLFHFSDVWKIEYWTVILILVWIMGTIGCLFSMIGGLKAITILDILLGIGFFAGGILLPFFGLKYIGHGSMQAGFHQLLTVHKEHLNSIGSSADAIPFGTLFTGMLLVNLYYWGTEQYIIQQVLASKDLKTSQKGLAVACLGKLISPLLLNIPGIIAVHIFSKMHNTAEVFPRLDSLVSPPFIAGFIAAVIFVAALTTFNAGLNSSSTLFMLNIYKPWLQKRSKQVPEKKLLRTAKQFEIAVCLAAMFIAPLIIFVKNGFYTYVQIVNGFFNVPIFTIMFMGFVTKKVPAIAAKIGLIFFIACYALTQLVVDTQIHFLHILAILFVVTCGIMLLIGKLYPMPVPYTLKLNNLVDIRPWKNRHYYTGILLILMIMLFILFSPLILSK